MPSCLFRLLGLGVHICIVKGQTYSDEGGGDRWWEVNFVGGGDDRLVSLFVS